MSVSIANLIDVLNAAAAIHWHFAVVMLLQSSMLIALLLILDAVWLHRVRSGIRYALWSLILLKLMLPVSLSSPLSLVQILPESPWISLPDNVVDEAVVPADQSRNDVVDLDPRLQSVTPFDAAANSVSKRAGGELTATVVSASPAAMSTTVETMEAFPVQQGSRLVISVWWQVCAFMAWLVTSLALGFLVWRQMARVQLLVHAAEVAPPHLQARFRACLASMKIHSTRVTLRMTDNLMSPAICGCWRAVVLLPRHLLTKLDEDRLDLVFRHELTHWRRGDLQVNWLQTVLQVLYFYNPLLWFANGVIRRLREEAVDESVLVESGGQAFQYASTLIDIAEWATNRREATLQFIGMTESRHSFYQRMQRMSQRPHPSRSRLGWSGLLAVLLFGFLLLPMARTGPFAADNPGALSSEQKAIQKIKLFKGEATTDQRAADGAVTVIDFRGSAKITSEYLHVLKAFPRLTQLDLSYCPEILDDALARISELQNLTIINLAETKITDDGLKSLGQLPRLQELYLHGTQITDAGLDALRDCKNLTLVDIRDTLVTDEGLQQLQESLPNLKAFDESPIVAQIARLEGRIKRTRTANGTPIVAIKFLGATSFNDDAVRLLKAFPKLVQLDLGKTFITDEGAKELGRLHYLEELRLGDTVISDAGLEKLKGLVKLSKLSLYGTKISDAGLKHLVGMQGLTELTLGSTKTTDLGLAEVAKLKNLTSLYLSWTKVTDSGLKSLAGLQELKKIDLRGTGITDEALRTLNDLQADLPSLVELNLRGTSVSDKCVNDLTGLKNLMRLNLVETKVTKPGLEELVNLECLVELIVDTTQVAGGGAKSLSDALPGTRITLTPRGSGAPRQPPQ